MGRGRSAADLRKRAARVRGIRNQLAQQIDIMYAQRPLPATPDELAGYSVKMIATVLEEMADELESEG